MMKEKVKKCLFTTCFTYETPKVVQIESKCIGILHNLLILSLVFTIIVWVFILNHGYQYVDYAPRTSSTSKVKGVSYTNSTDPRIGKRIWDSSDLYANPVGNGAFFLTTNVIITHEQSQNICPEEASVGADCQSNDDCLPLGRPYHLGHGTSTGICNRSNRSSGTCMVEAWCPIEDDSPPKDGDNAQLKHTTDFTVFIKNNVYFPFYEKTRSTLIEALNLSYLRSCHYHPTNDPYCPIFRLGDIVGMAMTKKVNTPVTNDKYFETMVVKGGVIAISIIWDCNFDYAETRCLPTYEFDRLDLYEGNKVSKGYNFRYSTDYIEQGVDKRHLIKAYGILFVLQVEATARAFHFKTCLLNIGSSLGILGLASVISEIILLRIHRRRSSFKKYKSGTK